MNNTSAIGLYVLGTIFAIGGYFNRTILIAGWIIFTFLAVIGLVFGFGEPKSFRRKG